MADVLYRPCSRQKSLLGTTQAVGAGHRPLANADMIEGYMDGYNLTAPEPSTNRSHSYRHSFWIGRQEKLGLPLPSYWELERRAELAILADAQV